jgi:histone H2B
MSGKKASQRSSGGAAAATASGGGGGGGGGKTKVKTPKVDENGNVIEPKKRRPRHESYGIYTYRVLKQIHPNASISTRTMRMIDGLLEHILTKYVDEAYALTRATSPKKKGIKTRTFQIATRQVLGGQLAVHAHSEGAKAVLKYNAPKA